MPNEIVATVEHTVSLFLYGVPDVPQKLTERLRDHPSGYVEAIDVKLPEYMDSVGRFAHAAAAPLVRDFFQGSLSSSLGTVGADGAIRLTVSEYLSMTGGNRDPINIQVDNYITGTNEADYGTRAFVWGQVSFRLSDETTFVWENGNLRIDNLVILPYDTNFDFESDNPAAQLLNQTVLEPLIDPQGLGRTLDLRFTEADKDAWVINPAAIEHGYDLQRFATDLQSIDAEVNPYGIGALESAYYQLVADLNASGVIEYHRDGRDIIYDTGQTIETPHAASILVGGGGYNRLNGSDEDDILYGGADSDTLVGGAGSDFIYGGDGEGLPGIGDGLDTADYSSGSAPITILLDADANTLSVEDGMGGTDTLHSIERIVGTSGFDYVRVSGYISEDLDLEIDGGGGQNSGGGGGGTSNESADVVNGVEISDAGLQVSIDENGNGFIGNRDGTGGQIALSGFHTQIVASDYGDLIVDYSDGHKRIDGGTGNDEISTAETSSDVMLYGGEGNDLINGGLGDDVIFGGASTLAASSDYDNVLGLDGNDLLVMNGTGIAYGGDGDDHIQFLFLGGVALGGAGNDYIQGFGDWGYFLDITGGEGDDIIDLVDAGTWSPVAISFAAGDGHDALYSTTSIDTLSIEIQLHDIDLSDVMFIMMRRRTNLDGLMGQEKSQLF